MLRRLPDSLSRQTNLENKSCLSLHFHLVYRQYRKSNLPHRRIEGSTKALVCVYKTWREMSIGRALLTRRILWRPIHKTRPALYADRCIYTRYCMPVQACDVLDSRTNVPGQTVPCRVMSGRVGDALCYSCAFAKRRRFSGAFLKPTTLGVPEFSLYKQASRAGSYVTSMWHLRRLCRTRTLWM